MSTTHVPHLVVIGNGMVGHRLLDTLRAQADPQELRLTGGQQVAVFHVNGRVFALGNRDPFTGASVLSRGLTGSTHMDGTLRLKVASPLLKHAFDLERGVSMEDPSVRVPVYEARVEGGEVWIGSEA